MSLTSFISMADVRAKLKTLRPGPPRKIPVALAVEPRSKRNQMVGAAFDYLLRFELQRRAPHCVARCWTAEAAPDIIWKKTDRGGGGLVLYRDDRGVVSVARDAQSANVAFKQESGLAEDMADRARKVIETAKSAHCAYLKTASPKQAAKAALAGHAIRLAKLTALVAAGTRGFDPTFEEAAEEDVEDLLALLAIAPFNALLHDTTLLLNPVFRQTSLLVGGADADLIAGDMLVDVKTTKSDSMATENLDELFGYYLLARRHRQDAPTFPLINRLALYFARHGYLWTWEVSTWTGHPQFAETEEWFFNRAKEAFRPRTERATPSQIKGTWSGVPLDQIDKNMTLGEMIRRGMLRVQPPRRS